MGAQLRGGGRRRIARHHRGAAHGRVARGRGRRERRHVPRARAPRRRSSPASSPITSPSTAGSPSWRRRSPASSPAREGRACCAPTTPPRSVSRSVTPGVVRYGFAETADYRHDRLRGLGLRFPLRAGARRALARPRHPLDPWPPQRDERGGRRRHGARARRPLRRGAAGAGTFRRARPPVRGPRRARRRHLHRRLRAPPHRGGVDGRRCARGRVGPHRRGLPAAPLLAYRRPLAATSPTRSSAPTSWCSPTCTPSTRPAIPGVTGRLVLRAVLDAHPDLSVVYLPRHADLARHVPRLTRPGDLVLTLGAGDLTLLPDVWLGAA